MALQTSDYYWSKKPKGTAHESIFPYITHLQNHQNYRQLSNIQNMRLYGNSEYVGVSAYNYSQPSTTTRNILTMNVIESMVDTVVSKVTKNKPKPYFLTDGGNWTQKRKAEKLTKFAEGQFYATDFYSKAATAFKDSCIFGTGVLKIFKIDGEIKVERVFIDEILVDDSEAIYGEPRQLHQIKWIHKDVLKAQFPSFATQIDSLGTLDKDQFGNYNKTIQGDMVKVAESWKRPSGKKAKDGKHVISIENATLFEAPYTKDYFPFVFFRWNERPLGFFGKGLSEQLTGIQYEINKLLKTIQVSMHLVSVPKLFVEASTKISTATLDNRIGSIIKYVGTPPTPGQLGVIPPELFAHLDRLYQRAYELAGVSALSAQSTKPSGLNSGKAMRTFNDLETERFMSVAMRYEKVFMDASKQMIDLAKQISDETNNYSVKVPGHSFLSTIKWQDVEMSEDQYIMEVWSIPYFSDSPSSRLQEVQEAAQAGLISQKDIKRLMRYPDIESQFDLDNAASENIYKVIEMMVDEGRYFSPEPFQDLDYGIKTMMSAYNKYQMDGAPEESLELMRNWISEADSLIKKANPPPAPMSSADPLQSTDVPPEALGVPAAPPVSDMLPVM